MGISSWFELRKRIQRFHVTPHSMWIERLPSLVLMSKKSALFLRTDRQTDRRTDGRTIGHTFACC